MRTARPLAITLLLTGCGWNSDSFGPVALVDKVRVLGVRADPPEIAPGAATRLDALVFDPDAGDRPLTKLRLLCDPDPSAAQGGACTQYTTALDPAQFLGGAVPGVRLAGGDRPLYVAPSDAISRLPADSLDRLRGVTALALLILFEGTDLSALSDPSRSLFALKRIQISDADPSDRNLNPAIAAVVRDGLAPLDTDTAAAIHGGSTVGLEVTPAPGSAQSYEEIQADGSTLAQTEPLVVSWYTTAGTYPDLHERSSRAPVNQPVNLVLPDAADVPGALLTVFAVLRDARGGIDWAQRDLRLVP